MSADVLPRPRTDQDLARLGTFAPFFRASDNPIAMACLRLVTFFPLLPDCNVPFLRRRMALSTFFDAALPYLVAIVPSIGIPGHAYCKPHA